MGCSHCFNCCKSSKDSNKELTRGETTGCFCCKSSSEEERKNRQGGGCGIVSLCCCCKSSSKDDSSETRGCCSLPRKKSSKGDTEIRGGKNKKYCSCFWASKEDSSKKEKREALCCFNCYCDDKLSGENSKNRGKNKKCFSCFSLSKKCCSCFRASKEDSSEKGKRWTLCCFSCCCDDQLSGEKSENKDKDKKCLFCFSSSEKCCSCFRATKEDSPEKGKNGTLCCFRCCCDDKLSGEDSENRNNDKKCFSCFRSSKEDSSKNDKRGTCCCFCRNDKSSKKALGSREVNDKKCFSCFKPSKENFSKNSERGTWCCFSCCNDKSSNKNLESTEVKDNKCFSCFRSSNEGSSKKEKRRRTCCNDRSPKEDSKSREEKDKKCFCCCRSSKNDSSRKEKCGSLSCFPCCNGKSSQEDSSKKEGEVIRCCLRCCHDKSSKDDSSKKGTRVIWCCFPSCVNKPSEEDSSKKSVQRGCFNCCNGKSLKEPNHDKTVSQKKKKKSKESSLKKRRNKVMCCCSFCCSESLDERKPTSKTRCMFSCFCCIQSGSNHDSSSKKRKNTFNFCWQIKEQPEEGNHLPNLVHTMSFTGDNSWRHRSQAEETICLENGNISARAFTYRELAAATNDFNCLQCYDGFGRVYRGELAETSKVVAVKQLHMKGNHGSKEFLDEVLMLSLLHHQNLVKLLGYCVEGDQRILVYEYMPFGSLQDHLFDIAPNNKPLDWLTRMKIAAGAAKGLEHLHDVADPPVIYRDMKASNIFLDENYNPKLIDFGLSKLGPVGEKAHVSTRVMGTHGYCAPEYLLTGQTTKMSDVYSYGVLLLELITGRKAIDTTRTKNEQYLVHWAVPLFKDKRKFAKMADPLLNGSFPIKGLYQALAIADMCLQHKASTRPLISDVATAIEYLAEADPEFSEPLEEPPILHQLSPSKHARTQISAMSFDEETFQSLSSDTESCVTLREEDE